MARSDSFIEEQEFMIAAEATGLTPTRRIFKHLVQTYSQLIVLATMDLVESFRQNHIELPGYRSQVPIRFWGNIINDASEIHVLKNYWFVWILRFLILITVMGFNFVGDGLRDAFDPK